MRDRHQLETVLSRRFPAATRTEIAAAANAIMALLDQWNADDREPCAAVSIAEDEGHERTHRH